MASGFIRPQISLEGPRASVAGETFRFCYFHSQSDYRRLRMLSGKPIFPWDHRLLTHTKWSYPSGLKIIIKTCWGIPKNIFTGKLSAGGKIQTYWHWPSILVTKSIILKSDLFFQKLVFPGYSNKQLFCEALFTCPDFLTALTSQHRSHCIHP